MEIIGICNLQKYLEIAIIESLIQCQIVTIFIWRGTHFYDCFTNFIPYQWALSSIWFKENPLVSIIYAQQKSLWCIYYLEKALVPLSRILCFPIKHHTTINDAVLLTRPCAQTPRNKQNLVALEIVHAFASKLSFFA